MMIYFVVYKQKKEKDYRMFSNEIFSMEKNANEFAKKSMKRSYEYKIVEYNKTNYDRYWYVKKT